MNSRVSWGVEGIDPLVRERAEAAARRAGMSLNNWLNSALAGSSATPDLRAADDPWQPPGNQHSREVADIHQRLDSITRQIEQISPPPPRPDAHRGEQGVARQLNEAISRLDARLAQISNGVPARDAQLQKQRQAEMVERAAQQVYRAAPPVKPVSLEFAIAEIAARQNELDAVPQSLPPRSAPSISPAAPPPSAGPDFSVLERHLVKITSQIEALQRPDGIEQSIAAFRGELSEIRQAITEAMPRKAIESIEEEIRSLSRRIEDTRQTGIDGQALAGIERALGDIRQVLRTLTPAEQLAGYDEAIRNLGAKLDLILRANDDPSTVQQLEGAIAALRGIVSNVASNDALIRLSDDVHTLAYKVDQVARVGNHSESFALLEQRLAALTSSLESRERPAATADNEQLERALRTLSERLDRMPVGNDNASAFAHLEQRVSYLLERLESSDRRGGNLAHVEQGLHDILRHLETQHAIFEALTENKRSAAPDDPGLVDMVKRELSDIRLNQAEAERHTQNSLEGLNSTLGHVVNRLTMIEGDLRTVRVVSDAPELAVSLPQPTQPARVTQPITPRAAMAPQTKPELPNPAKAEGVFAAAPRDFHAASRPAVPAVSAPLPPKAITEILEPHAAMPPIGIETDLPPDHPLEPGTRPSARVGSPSERIAASENAISQIPPGVMQVPSAGTSERARASSFIAAARRAAQAAQAAPENAKAGGGPLSKFAGDKGKQASTIASKIRSLLVGASVVVIVLGTFKLTMSLLDGGSGPQQAPIERSSEGSPSAFSPPSDGAKLDAAPTPPSMSSPMPIDRQSINGSAPSSPEGTVSVPIPQTPLAPAPAPPEDVTGAIPDLQPGSRKLPMVQVPPSERLPDAIGGPVLRAAALKGDPAAAYEIALRFAEGKGVTANFDLAAKWYERAAQAGVVPAIFRLGTLYEKGLGVQKDVQAARRLYMQAAEFGNAKAMHNVAVLEADGGGKGANYKGAAQWFRKAADRGVADSQFNLGILYARGIGVEQNLAESFKWFSLAAAQGDADSARKRDDLAKRLDPQSLAAAQLAVQTFTPEPQPEDAIKVASPPGGWDATTAAKPGSVKRAAR
jgi:localization factor PodJL